ncbi:MAG: EamA family transporter [Chitinophagaceae bacterium]|nr:MAG: EamA family transporter [Chitinophagaceae bacterium]
MKKAFLQLHLAVFLAGFTAILGKLIQLSEGVLVWWRILLTVIVLAGWLRYSGKLERLSVRSSVKIAVVGFIIALHWILFYGSIKYATISVALVCFSATGFFTSLLEPIILKRQVQWLELALGLLSIAGLYIIFDFHPQYKLGILFGLLSAVGSALFPIFNKELLLKYKPETLSLYELGGGLILLTLILPLYHQFFPANYYWPTPQDWIWLLVLAIFCTVLLFLLQLNALKKISAFTSNLTFNLEPVYGILMAFLFFDESKMLHKEFFIGLALIVLAVVLQMMMVWNTARKNRNITA